MRSIVRVSLMMAWLLAALLPASGASAIFYSKADNSYGWCAGYSYSRSESCAREQCLELGSGCELAIECDGGWSATAFAPDPYAGFGASCEWQNAGIARSIALLSCIYASHALCTTSTAFDGNARSTSDKSNDAYDLAWYTQSLLLALGYDIGEVDGEIGSRTRSAIADFQSKVGVEATGKADWTVMGLLLYAYGGSARFVRDTIAEVDAADPQVVQTYTYRYASAPSPDFSLAAELANHEESWRRTIVAALVAYNSDAACSLPATGVTGTDSPGTWAVTCAEGTYLLALAGPTPVVTFADAIPEPQPLVVACAPGEDPLPNPGPGTQQQQQAKPSPNTINGPSPDLAPLAADCVAPGADFKPSPNTVNGMAPNLGAAGGN